VTGSFWWDVAVGIAAALILAWVALIVVLAILRPPSGLLREAVRILPDVPRLIRRLAADKTLPSGVRTRLWLLLAYLAMPFDLIPDFIPVLGTRTTPSSSPRSCAASFVEPESLRCGATGPVAMTASLRCAASLG
jgi:hypothetical protein